MNFKFSNLKNLSLKKKGIVLGTLVGLVIFFFFFNNTEEMPKWRTTKIDRGPIRQRITSTGTLSGLLQVNIGSQISGIVSNLYVDFNTPVKKGQKLAEIDPTTYAALVSDAQATVQKTTQISNDAKRQFERQKRRFEAKLISEKDLQDAESAKISAESNLISAKAALTRAQVNLDYCTIKSPLDGIVISRLVDRGQTVAASFNTPNMFVIAQDLTRMKLEANIDEADIGQVKLDQQAFFSVDAFPDTQFAGRVMLVRIDPRIQQNVVNYTVQIEVDNSELKIRPGMTANVTIFTASRDSVLRIPSSALRFNPVTFLPPKAQEAFNKKLQDERNKAQEEMKKRMAQVQNPSTTPVTSIPEKSSTPAVTKPSQDAQGSKPPVGRPDGPPGASGARGGWRRNMTPEQIEAFRKNMTPEQIAALRKQRESGGGNIGDQRPGGRGRSDTRPTSLGGIKPISPVNSQDTQSSKRSGTTPPSTSPMMLGGSGKGFVSRREDRVWIVDSKGELKSVKVSVGLSDGQYTEITESELPEGSEVLVGVIDPIKKSGSAPTTASPMGGGMGRGR
ncbi:MAG: efflux RND transporter periplasmic adaptor subunit [Holophagaceae bacterium]